MMTVLGPKRGRVLTRAAVAVTNDVDGDATASCQRLLVVLRRSVWLELMTDPARGAVVTGVISGRRSGRANARKK